MLSIGGIQGYTMAMRRYQANEIINIATKYATIIWTGINNDMLNDTEKYVWSEHGSSIDYYTELPDDYLKKTDHGYFLFYEYSEESYAHLSNSISFNDAGLGALPSGVKNMTLHLITASKSGILVNIAVELEDKALCETLKSQLDVDPLDYFERYKFCENYNGSYFIPIGVPQN